MTGDTSYGPTKEAIHGRGDVLTHPRFSLPDLSEKNFSGWFVWRSLASHSVGAGASGSKLF